MRETELKFKVDDLQPFREKLSIIGKLKEARVFEDNIVFDDEQGTLRSKKQLLRLRQSGDVRLTFKTPIEKKRYKIMDEREVAVSGFEQALGILNGLGYRQAARYQKYRTVFRVDDALVMLDETPIGSFIELEGSEKLIDRIADQLELDIDSGTTLNYLELYREHCSRFGGDPDNMVFEQGQA